MLTNQRALLVSAIAIVGSLAASGCTTTRGKGGGDESVVSAAVIPTKNEPSPRSLHTALWTGDGMLVWGGMVEGSTLTEASTGGGIFYPGSKKWYPLPKHTHSTRYHHSAVWTGLQMIVWGGVEGNGDRTSSGLMLDTEDNEWFGVSEEGSPSPRSGHTAVWTGERMLVWGGEGPEEQFYSDGGVYDLVGDKWEALSSDGAPGTRSFHTAVWTGSKMIVWGGMGPDGAMRTGAIYDPATKEWTEMTESGAPQGRFSHSVVWTGSRMIVWGGRGEGDTYLADGGIYDPENDKWSALPTRGAPSARELHTAIWTGKEMIIWGGTDQRGPQSVGAAYDPESKTWERFKVKRKTPSRYMHSAVWTGQELLVWGGRTSNGKFVKKKGGLSIPFEGDEVEPRPAAKKAGTKVATRSRARVMMKDQ